MAYSRRSLGRAGAAALLPLAGIPTAHAQARFPNRPIRIVIGFPPGGAVDIVVRLIAPRISQALGQPVVVDNRPGANGVIAAQEVARAAADGYTILAGTSGSILFNGLFNPSLPIRADRDFAPITQLARLPFLFFAGAQTPFNSIPELIAYARANPGELTYGSSGNGSLPHLAGELFNMMTGAHAVHVPYRGSVPAMTDLAGGRIAISVDTLSSGLPQLQAGRIKALAVTGPERIAELPDVPTMAETLPGYVVVNWHGVVAPAQTPLEVVKRLQTEIAAALADPEIRSKILAQGIEPLSSEPEAFAAFMVTESERWSKVIRDAGIRIE